MNHKSTILRMIGLMLVLAAIGLPWPGDQALAHSPQSGAAQDSPPGGGVTQDISSPPSGTRQVTFEELGYTEDETVQGITSSRSFGFQLPASWTVQPGNEVTLQFSHSPMLAEYSSMAVDFNSVRIGSVLLTPDNSDHGTVNYSLPENLFQAGFNYLTINFYMGIHANYCEDAENPGVWATIHNASTFDLNYESDLSSFDLGLFPYPLLDRSELLLNQVTMVVPEQPSVVELGVLASISARLSQLNVNQKLDIHVISEAQLVEGEQTAQGHLLYIGRADHLKILTSESLPFVKAENGRVSFITLDGRTIDSGNGVLWLGGSPGDNAAARLIVSGETDEALTLAARGLSNDKVYPLLQGQLGIIQGVSDPPASSLSQQPEMSLQDMGYEDATVHGAYQQAVTYVSRLSREWQVLTEATFELHFAHSDLLYPQGSILTVTVNDTPVGNTQLTPENADDARLTVSIPARVFKIGANTIKIVTNAQLPYDPEDQYFCNRDHYFDAWVTVYSDSVLKLPAGPTVLNLDLGNYPFGFMGAADLSDLQFVVPAQSTLDTAQALAWLAAGLGRYADGDELSPKVINADSLTSTAGENPYQILVGEPVRNKAIYQLNKVLPLPFVEGTNIPQNSERIPRVLASSEVNSVGYLEAALTEAGHVRLVVTGSDAAGLKWAAQALTDAEMLAQLNGDLAILQSPDSVYTDSIRQPSQSREPASGTETNPPSAVSLSQPSARWVIWLASGVFLVTLVIIGSSLLSSFFKSKT